MRRMLPLMLVGEGAIQFSRQRGIQVIEVEEMVAPRAREERQVGDRCGESENKESENEKSM